MITISAVVPAYNAERYIEQTLLSLMSQTMPLCEIIVVDDCSSDATVDAVMRLQETSTVPLKLICHEYNQGVSAARNHGWAAASGEWLLFMDADDVAEPTLLEAEVAHWRSLQQEPYQEWVVIYPAYAQINAAGEPMPGVMRGVQLASRNAFGCQLLRNHLITPSGVLVNKAAIMNAGGFRLGLTYQVEDWDLWLKLAKAGGGFAYVDEPLVKVRRHSANATKSMAKALQAELEILAFYEPEVIREALFARELPPDQNAAGYAGLLFKLGQWDDGYEVLKQAGGAENATVLFLQGLYWLHQENLTQARVYFEQTLQVNDYHGAALNNLGAIYAVAGDFSTAEELWRKALSFFPGYMDVLANLKLFDGGSRSLQLAAMQITWRELRPVLLSYSE